MSENPVQKRFAYDSTTDKSTCKKCSFVMRGKHSANLGRHLKRKHPDEYRIINEETNIQPSTSESFKKHKMQDKNSTSLENYFGLIKINMTAKHFTEACVKLVTINGRPFTIFKDSGMRDIIEPIMKSLHLTVNSENIKDLINDKANEVKNVIIGEIRNKFISLKIDSASRLGRSVIGINAQYICNGKIHLRTLAMYEVDDRQTANYIKNVIIEVIQSYDININQVYSVTSDNGRNMIKAAELLRNEFEVSDLEEVEDEINELITENNEDEGLEILSNIHGDIIHFRCVAHTAQLAVYDTISSVKQKIDKCRNISKKLRVPNRASLAKKLGIKKAILDCPTRWNSTFDMLHRLLDFKTFCSDVIDPELSMDDEMWDFVSDFIKIFEPVKNLTLKLQNEQMNLGDFYGLWLKFKLDLERNTNKQLGADLYSHILKREKYFIENELLNAAVYLDPRFRLMLSNENTTKAQKQILTTIQNLKNLHLHLEKQTQTSTETRNADATKLISSSSDEEDSLEELLKNKEKKVNCRCCIKNKK